MSTDPTPDEVRPKAPNLADLRTMAEIGYPVRLDADWLAWIVEQIDSPPATPGEPSPPAEHVGVDQPGVLWMAMRYALGRATYAVGEVGDAIDSHADQLTDTHRHRMAAEIATAIAGDRAGMDMDVVVWRRAIVRLVGDESARVLLSGGEQ